ncbi:lysozyme [Treponema pedis]
MEETAPGIDGYGNWTIGYGHKITAKEAEAMKNGIDVDTAEKFFQQDIEWIEDRINKNFDGIVPLSQNEFGALVSLGFNAGRGALVNSKIFCYAEVTDPSYFKNKHDSSVYEKAITNKFREYNNANKKYSLGLDKRRIDEAEIFLW